MADPLYCAFCKDIILHGDSFTVETPQIVQIFHYTCGSLVTRALGDALLREFQWHARAETPLSGYRTKQPTRAADQEELIERLLLLEDVTRGMKKAWAAWIKATEQGAIDPETIKAIKILLDLKEDQ